MMIGDFAVLDDIDRRIIQAIQADCRRSYAAIGAAVGLSISGVNERLKRLQRRGVVRGCVAVVEPRAVGLDVCAFVRVLLERPEHEPGFLEGIAALPAVQEAHHVTGDYSYLLKVRVRDTAALEGVLSGRIKALPGVVRTETQIALSTPKETTALDLGDGSEET
jgi:Lrp/AsnC family transcriptional regulator, leucine-responsive regulatory protein